MMQRSTTACRYMYGEVKDKLSAQLDQPCALPQRRRTTAMDVGCHPVDVSTI